MFKKEIRDSVKQFVECSMILLVIPIAFLIDKFFVKFGWTLSEAMEIVLVIITFVYAFYSGITFLNSEKKDKAFEYLLSLPVPRLNILIKKVIPRFLILIVLMALLGFFWKTEILLNTGFWILIIFFSSLFLSAVIDSIILGLIGVIMLPSIYFALSRTIGYLAWKLKILSFIPQNDPLLSLIAAVILLLPLGIAFWLFFKKMDLKPIKYQLKPYYYIAFPALVFDILFVVVFHRQFLSWLQNK